MAKLIKLDSGGNLPSAAGALGAAVGFSNSFTDNIKAFTDLGNEIRERQDGLLTNAAIQEAIATGKMPEGLSDRVDSGALMEALYQNSASRRNTADAERLEYENSPEYRAFERTRLEQQEATRAAQVRAMENANRQRGIQRYDRSPAPI